MESGEAGFCLRGSRARGISSKESLMPARASSQIPIAITATRRSFIIAGDRAALARREGISGRKICAAAFAEGERKRNKAATLS